VPETTTKAGLGGLLQYFLYVGSFGFGGPVEVNLGPRTLAEAGLKPSDLECVSIHESFTITGLITLEDLGFSATRARAASSSPTAT